MNKVFVSPSYKRSVDYDQTPLSDLNTMTVENPLVDVVLDCIKYNEGEKLRDILQGLDPKVSDQLLNKPIPFNQHVSEKPSRMNCFKKLEYKKILFIAGVSGADTVVEVLLDFDIDILAGETCGGNILHALCWGSYFYKKNQQSCVKIFKMMMRKLGVQERKKLLMETDEEDFRPLELATKLGTFLLLRVYLETDGVYRHRVERMGAWDLVEYTFNEYESVGKASRVHRSPMKLLTYILETDLYAEGAIELLNSPAIQKWILDKRRMTRVLLLMWLCVRTVLLYYAISLFTSFNYNFDVDNSTITRQNGTHFFDAFSGKESCVFLILGLGETEVFSAWSLQTLIIACGFFDLIDFCKWIIEFKDRKKLRRPGVNAHYVANHDFHRIIQSVYMLGVQSVVMQAFNTDPEVAKLTAPYLVVISLFTASWTFLFIMQHYPKVGHLAIGFQRSLVSFGAFSFLFFLIFMSFTLGTFILANISCFRHSLMDSFYYTFQIFLNQINVDQETAHTDHNYEWRIFHITFVVITTVLLLNYFIAVLSESMMAISTHKETIQNLVLLNTAILLDDRFGWLIRRIKGYKARKRGTLLGNFQVREGL